MKLAGFTNAEFSARRLLNDPRSQSTDIKGVEAWHVFRPDEVELHRHLDTERPVLRIGGYLDRVVVVDQQLPYGINNVSFDTSKRPRMAVDYEFSDKQLQGLVAKGLFHEGFKPPRETLMNVDLEFKAPTDMYIVAPEHPDHPPVVIVDTLEASHLTVDQKTAGYDLAVEFEDILTAEAEAARAKEKEDVKDIDFEDVLNEEQQVPNKGMDKDFAIELKGKSVSDRLRELSGGEVELSAEQILEHLQLSDEDLSAVASEYTDSRTEWEKSTEEFYNNKVRSQMTDAPERKVGESVLDTLGESEETSDIDFDGFDDDVLIDTDDEKVTPEAEAEAVADTEAAVDTVDTDKEAEAEDLPSPEPEEMDFGDEVIAAESEGNDREADGPQDMSFDDAILDDDDIEAGQSEEEQREEDRRRAMDIDTEVDDSTAGRHRASTETRDQLNKAKNARKRSAFQIQQEELARQGAERAAREGKDTGLEF